MSKEETKMVTLKSSDGEVFEVQEEVATKSQTLKEMIEDKSIDTRVILLPNVSRKILAKVIDYCKKHVDALKNPDDTKPQEDELKTWDAEFVKVDQATLFDLILAADYLNIKNLLDLTRQTVGYMFKGKMPEEIRKMFNMVTLKSSDGEVFEVEEEVAIEMIKHVIKDECVDTGFPLPNVSSKILAKVIEYCKKHIDALKNPDDTKLQEEELKTWDAEFVKVDQATLFDLILAANYLKIRNLLDLTCQTVADMIKGKTPEEIKKTFNLKNNFTPEEEEEVCRKNQWAFE